MATIHFEILRRIAETASGMRYQDTWFEVTDTDVEIWDHEPTGSELQPNSTVIMCTAWQRPPIPPVTRARIASDGDEIDLLAVPVPEQELQGWVGPKMLQADAVFWSASAVEKFLMPYYASTYGSMAPKAVAQLLNVFVPAGSPELQGNAMMELMDAPSAPVDLTSDLGTPTVTVTDPAGFDQPFAVVHLPSSEYTAGTPADDGGAVPRLYTLHRSGAVKKLRVPAE
ncbi:MAG TPA: hypothetical protein VEX86_07535 [Longimicrobium sp.]|nr:hypothetical protein [Longimicrobium sp.]